jgi:hypothetical protein
MRTLFVVFTMILSNAAYAQPCTQEGLTNGQICVDAHGFSQGSYNCGPALNQAQRAAFSEAAQTCGGRAVLIKWGTSDCYTPTMDHNTLDYTNADIIGLFQCVR